MSADFSPGVIESGVLIAIVATVIIAIVVAACRHWFRGLGEALSGVKHELVPNSGASLRDAVDRIEKAQIAAALVAVGHGEKLAGLAVRLEDHIALASTESSRIVQQAAAIAITAHDERHANAKAIIDSGPNA